MVDGKFVTVFEGVRVVSDFSSGPWWRGQRLAKEEAEEGEREGGHQGSLIIILTFAGYLRSSYVKIS